jgi:Ser/Thr protein kinase RdoA (MazF antagonist)
MSDNSTALMAITAAAPTIDESVVMQAVHQQFGLQGECSSLVSERDQNFLLRTADARQFLVKVTSAVEEAATTDFQISALQHIENAGDVLAPRVVPTLRGDSSGQLRSDGNSHRLRVMTWVNGEQLENSHIDAALAERFGRALAELDRALQGYSHPGENPALLWDLHRVTELRDLLDAIRDPAVTVGVAKAIDDYENHVVPALPTLRAQVIHSDANPENVLVAGKRLGFIDFGDAIKAPLVFDVAIAASYMRVFDGDPTTLIEPFVAGYHAVLPLQEIENRLLFDLIRARLTTTITLLYWRLRTRPENDPYRQKALDLEGGAEKFLIALDSLGRSSFNNRISKLYR